MNRRRFVRLAVQAAAAASWAGAGKMLWGGPGPARSAPPAGSSDGESASGRKLIIPTDTPDRFRLKVMEFNPVPAPHPAAWELEVGGLVRRSLKLRLAELKRLPAVDQRSRLKCVKVCAGRIPSHRC